MTTAEQAELLAATLGLQALATVAKSHNAHPNIQWVGDNATVEQILKKENWRTSHQEKSKLLKWILTQQKTPRTIEAKQVSRKNPIIQKTDALSKRSRQQKLTPPPCHPHHTWYWIQKMAQHEPIVLHKITRQSSTIQYCNLCQQLKQKHQDELQTKQLAKHEKAPHKPNPRLLWRGKHAKVCSIKKTGYAISSTLQEAFYLRAGVWDFIHHQPGATCTKCKQPATFEHFALHCTQPVIVKHRKVAIQEARTAESKYAQEAKANEAEDSQPKQRKKKNKTSHPPQQPPTLLPQPANSTLIPKPLQVSNMPPSSGFRTEWLWKGHLPIALAGQPTKWQTKCKFISRALEMAAVKISKEVLCHHAVWIEGSSSTVVQPSSEVLQAQRKCTDAHEEAELKKALRAQHKFVARKKTSQ